jgi:argininosuccinate lyase
MPHKKNPDVFELIRAKCNKIMALPNEIMLITGNLASGYHRDLQVIKESFLPVFAEIKDCLAITNYSLQHIVINKDSIKSKIYDYLFSVEVVNDLVLKGTSFRDAYRIVGENIEKGIFEPNYDVNHTHEGSIGNLCNDKIQGMADEILKQFPFGSIDSALNKLLDK